MADGQAFGNPFTAQRDFRAGNAIVVFESRGVIAVTGTDRLSYLDSLLSQNLTSLAPFASAEALLLDPNGHVERAARIVDDGETTWLLVDEDQAPAFAAFLDRMTFSKDAAARDASSDFATVGFFSGGNVESLVSDAASLVWNDPWGAVVSGGWQYADAVEHPSQGWNYAEALVPLARLSSLDACRRVGIEAWDALRIAAWRPRLSTEVDASALPHETDWLRTAVHLNKGCYRGQETVAKVHNLGHPPRRLVLLHLDGTTNTLPEEGASVLSEGAEVGRVTSAARHFELGPIALATVKRTLPVDAPLEVSCEGVSLAAAQEVIVPPTAGRTVDVPKIGRLGRVSRTPAE